MAYQKLYFFLLIKSLILLTINAGQNTLVLLDNLAIKETHSMFFKSLLGMYI